jgi:hypothetical protein
LKNQLQIPKRQNQDNQDPEYRDKHRVAEAHSLEVQVVGLQAVKVKYE